jgi:TfoX/Sxy family transcriptional regulator of competence genes
MAFDAALGEKVRRALPKRAKVEEKRMFSGLTFMVNGKMCVSVGRDKLMCRVDPALTEELAKRKGCRRVVMKGRALNGYFHVDREALGRKAEFDFWMNSALAYNRRITL